MKRAIIQVGLAVWLLWAAVAFGGDRVGPIELKDGDRVVLIGGTLIERDAESGYLETRLAGRFPGRSIVFRNLGWSGDTVEGTSRGESLGPVAGFRQLVEHVVALKPTVVILGYGANESFGGEAGLPAFRLGLDRLWTALAVTGAKIVVLSPNRQENLGPPLPDPSAHNADLARYRDALRLEAARRGALFLDLFEALPDGMAANPPHPWTTNGLHLTLEGYWKASSFLAPALVGDPAPPWKVSVGEEQPQASATTLGQPEIQPTGARFTLLDDQPPDPARPGGGVEAPGRILRVAGLAPGRYRLAVDGQAITSADAEAWNKGVAISNGPEFAQVEALRSRINAKNLMYFHRWRPQNETYLFGFRKHEQGKNAAELAAFDPLIAAAEAEIVRLSRPVPHAYELVRLREGEVSR